MLAQGPCGHHYRAARTLVGSEGLAGSPTERRPPGEEGACCEEGGWVLKPQLSSLHLGPSSPLSPWIASLQVGGGQQGNPSPRQPGAKVR